MPPGGSDRTESLGPPLDRDVAAAASGLPEAPPFAPGEEPLQGVRALPFGGRIGRFRLIELLGEGGMGSVWLAEQSEPVKRRVALKLMREALLSATARARFDGERQALARLSHPAIAQMFEAGTAEAVPWFAMELVGGEPVTAYCDRRNLSIRERLELFIAICRGVQFAHQKGILHRDLKPSNLLVSEVDSRPLPKIIDFGIAKAIDEPLSDATQLGAGRLLGTPGYVSPESWSAGADIDTRSDVYSLGIVLYELVCGVEPYDLSDLSLAPAIQRITATEPPSPSRRLRESDERARRDAAAARGLEPPAHLRALAGDLDAIVGKAIARDRERRYDSASALVADLERHLAFEPIVARAPSFAYRTRKFVRRHRAAVTVAALSAAALVAALAGALRESARARKSEARAAAVAAFLSDTLGSADPWTSPSADLTVRQMLDSAVPRLETELASSPDVRADLLETISSTYYHLRVLDRAEATSRQALALRREVYGEESVQAAASMNDLALSLPPAKRAEAQALLRHGIEIRRKARGDRDGSVARGYLDLSGLVVEPVERERLLRASLAIRETLSDPGTLGFSLRGLGEFLIKAGRLEEAEPLVLRAVAIATPDGLAEERGHFYLAELRFEQGRLAEAEESFHRCLELAERIRGPVNVKLGEMLLGLAAVFRLEGRFAESEPLTRRALAIFRDPRSLSAEHEATSLAELGALSRARGDFATAEAELVEAREVWKRDEDPDNPGRAEADWALGALLHERGRNAEAEPLLCGGLERWSRLYAATAPGLLAARRECAALLREGGREEAARAAEAGAARQTNI